jgi:hypothetical protein
VLVELVSLFLLRKEIDEVGAPTHNLRTNLALFSSSLANLRRASKVERLQFASNSSIVTCIMRAEGKYTHETFGTPAPRTDIQGQAPRTDTQPRVPIVDLSVDRKIPPAHHLVPPCAYCKADSHSLVQCPTRKEKGKKRW